MQDLGGARAHARAETGGEDEHIERRDGAACAGRWRRLRLVRVRWLSVHKLSARRAGEQLARARSLFVTGDDDARQLVGTVPDFLPFVEQVCAHDLGLATELFFELVIG